MHYYLVIDSAGRWFDGEKFNTYDHNQAQKFENFSLASTVAKRYNATVESL